MRQLAPYLAAPIITSSGIYSSYVIIILWCINFKQLTQGHINLQITVESLASPDTVRKVIPEKFHKVVLDLATGDCPSVAKAVMAEPSLRKAVLTEVAKTLDDECSSICTTVPPVSLFRRYPLFDRDLFSFKNCIVELQSKCPTLYQLLWTIVTKTDCRNTIKHDDQHYPGLCMAVALILKERNQHMTGLQTFLSLVLFNCNVQKKVCRCDCTCSYKRSCDCWSLVTKVQQSTVCVCVFVVGLPGNQILISKYLARRGVVVLGGWSNGSGWQQTTKQL